MAQRIITAITPGLVPGIAIAACLAATATAQPGTARSENSMERRLTQYESVRLTADLSKLAPHERELIPLLIEAAQPMDEIFWMEASGDKDTLLKSITDPRARRYAEINYGPWDRLAGNEPFVEGAGLKPPGAGFYPRDICKDEFETHVAEHPQDRGAFESHYTVIRRDNDHRLVAIPYHQQFAGPTRLAAQKLQAAAAGAQDPGLRRYLMLRSVALLGDEYRESDMAWMEMKSNTIDIVIGPIETYEDGLFGYKAAHEAYVLIKDQEWSSRLARYAELLPALQRELPVGDAYKTETPGSASDLNAYDVVYYAGDCNAGSKTIAINLPNDEEVQLRKGTRRLQLKNAMRAKFDHILVPIAGALIDPDQRRHITFDAFFANTMFHEVAHGLGIKNTINGKGPVRMALKEQASALEEGKADVLGLYMVTRLLDQGVLTQGTIEDSYVTFLASIFRSVRFGAASAHGRANMLRFNFFKDMGAFTRNDSTGTYRVIVPAMRKAVDALSAKILTLQGDGDYDNTLGLMAAQGDIGPALQADLDRLATAGIPVDIVFEQGMAVLGAR